MEKSSEKQLEFLTKENKRLLEENQRLKDILANIISLFPSMSKKLHPSPIKLKVEFNCFEVYLLLGRMYMQFVGNQKVENQVTAQHANLSGIQTFEKNQILNVVSVKTEFFYH
ncbi:hypothetical protein RZN25_06460 [Bacillaceae bacterium S4-13-56]